MRLSLCILQTFVCARGRFENEICYTENKNIFKKDADFVLTETTMAERKSTFVILTLERFFLGLTTSLAIFIISSYFSEALPSVAVGTFYFVSSVAILATLLSAHRIIARIGRSRFLIALLVANTLISAFLAALPAGLLSASLLVVFLVSSGLLAVLLDMIVESFTRDAVAGGTHGLQWMIYYLGFIPGTFLSTYLVQNHGFGGVFFVLVVLYAAMLVLALTALSNLKRLNHITHEGIISLVRRTYHRAWMRRVYFLAVGLQFFYAVMAIYMPLHLRAEGFSWEEIGVIFVIMLLPFVLLEYVAGVAADRYWGERELLFVGTAITLVSMILISLLHSGTLALWAGVLFLSRVGAALIEIMSDAYFFKHVEEGNIGMIDVYRTAAAVGYLAAMTMALSLSMFVDDIKTTMFAVTVLVFALMLAVIWRLKDTPAISEKKSG